MKRIFLFPILILILLSQTGCWGWLSGQANTITHYDKDGFATAVEELTDDGMYYKMAANYKTESYKAAQCDNCTFSEKIALIAIMALADKGFVPKGMNGYELVKAISGDVVRMAPYAGMAYAINQMAQSPGEVNMNGDGATYAPFEVHQTYSDNSTITVPYRWQSPDATADPFIVP